MSHDATLLLPGNVEAYWVALVLARVLGSPTRTDANGCWAVAKTSVSVRRFGCQPGVRFLVRDATVCRSTFGTTMWYESGHGSNRRFDEKSTALNIAVMRRLAKFFGGKVRYDDATNRWDYRRPPHGDADNQPKSDRDAQAIRYRIWRLKPISPMELDWCRRLAYYTQEREIGRAHV